MLKNVSLRPPWITNTAVTDIYAVASCISDNFANYIEHWRHNGYWLFNKPSDMDSIPAREGTDRSCLTLFYYEVHEQAFDEDSHHWVPFAPEASFPTEVAKPPSARLQGFDIVSFYAGTAPECSPLSCNALGDEIQVNEHCLLATFEEAVTALETGKFANCEPGPFRIFAVYLVERVDQSQAKE
jgi:hypothetical protein